MYVTLLCFFIVISRLCLHLYTYLSHFCQCLPLSTKQKQKLK
jgi:hypothetical protein